MRLTSCLAATLFAAIATTPAGGASAATPAAKRPNGDPYPSTYRPVQAPPVLFRGAIVLTGTGERLDGGDVLVAGGRVQAVGRGLEAPAGATIVDASGKWITPGLIDVHSHLGVYPSPGMNAHEDGNEMVDPVTPYAWAEHAVWPQDPGFAAALAGGVTTLQVLPGSGNLIGGRGVTLRNVAAVTYQAMKFPGAPWGLKMACGENPKRIYGSKGGPMTRMGNVAGYRAAFLEAQGYMRSWDKFLAGEKPDAPDDDVAPKKKRRWGRDRDEDKDAPKGDTEAPDRDLAKDTLMGAMKGEILVHIHCYRADEMAIMLDLAREFGFKVAAFHHGVEAYKLADRLAAEGVCGALWADWWGFKMEALDGIEENIPLVDRPANGCAIVHSDSSEGIQRLNQEAAKAMAHARRVGIEIAPERAIRWLTANPARALGIDAQTGTLEPGKLGDVVVWNRSPFSVYAQAEKVYVDGALLYDRGDRSRQPASDFVLGHADPAQEVSR
jgi:imidazolonepropionase-like amidohydrolase